MIVRGRNLVEQASQRLSREDTDHGVMMSGHWRYKPLSPIQLCSIDTLRARNLRPKAKLIVIDEAHYSISDSYKEFLKDYPDAYILAVTATPFTSKSLSHIASVIVKPITMSELIDKNFLVKARYFAPSIPDLSKVETSKSTGDYVQDQLGIAVDNSTLIGDIVDHWKRIAENRPTICFAVNIEHSNHIVNSFKSVGISAEHCEASTSDSERKEILKRLESGETRVVSNVGILCTGVDLPFVSCLIMARPTKSYNLYIQQAGRGTRIFNGKSDFILLDHAANISRHGFIHVEREAFLEPDRESKKGSEITLTTCGACFAVFEGTDCPNCGLINERKVEREITHEEGSLIEITELSEDAKIKMFIKEKKEIAKQKGYRRGWTFHQLVAEYGEEIAQQYMPKRIIPNWVKQKYAKPTL